MTALSSVPIHPVHLGSLCAIGLMAAFAIAATASPWMIAKADFGSSKVTYTVTLWGFASHDGHYGDRDASWVMALDSDQSHCPPADRPSQKEVLKRYQVAEAGAILTVLGSIVFGIVAALYALGKFERKLLLGVPAAATGVAAMMAFGGYMNAYNACVDSHCELLVAAWKTFGAASATCGPHAGVFLIWIAVACGVGAFVGLMLVTPPALAVKPPQALSGSEAAAAMEPKMPQSGCDGAPYRALPSGPAAGHPLPPRQVEL